MGENPRDPYDLVEKLITQNTEGLHKVDLGMVEMRGALGQLIDTSSQARSELRMLKESFDALKDQHLLMYNHYFGSDGISGLVSEHKKIKERVGRLDEQGPCLALDTRPPRHQRHRRRDL